MNSNMGIYYTWLFCATWMPTLTRIAANFGFCVFFWGRLSWIVTVYMKLFWCVAAFCFTIHDSQPGVSLFREIHKTDISNMSQCSEWEGDMFNFIWCLRYMAYRIIAPSVELAETMNKLSPQLLINPSFQPRTRLDFDYSITYSYFLFIHS